MIFATFCLLKMNRQQTGSVVVTYCPDVLFVSYTPIYIGPTDYTFGRDMMRFYHGERCMIPIPNRV
jgi:hypothetical protein